MSIVPSERCSPSVVVDIRADIATDSLGSRRTARAGEAERTAGAVLEYSNAEGSRRVPKN